MRQTIQLIIVQFKVYLREPEVLFWGVVFPVVMAIGLGIAFSKKDNQKTNIAIVAKNTIPADIKKIGSDTIIYDSNHSVINEIQKTIGNSKIGNTQYRFLFTQWNDAIKKVKRGEIALILTEEKERLIYHFDPANPDAKAAYMQISTVINNPEVYDNYGNIRPLERKGTRYIDFLIPGLLGLNIMASAMWGISYSLIEMRSKKLLRRMMVTPMKKGAFFFSHAPARIMTSFVESAILLFIAWIIFDTGIQGSIAALIAILAAGNIAFIGIAILFSSRTSNTQVGNALINIVVMPMMVCSGVFFSYSNFPDTLIPIIQHLPLSMLADGIRSICIEGAGLNDVAPNIAVLCSIGIVSYFAGQKIYKWY